MEKQIVSNKQFELMIERLVYQLIENHSNFLETVIIGVQPRGVELSNRILEKYPERVPVICEKLGNDLPDLDRYKFLVPNVKKINIMSEMSYNKKLLYKPIEKFNLNQN